MDIVVNAQEIDSADRSAIHYLEPSPPLPSGSAWFYNESGSLTGAVLDSTLSGCNARGASIVFKFNGSSVYAYGSVVDSKGDNPPVSAYSVDGNSPISFTAPTVSGRRDAVRFFSSGALPLGNHTLTVNISSASPLAPYYLDYFQYTTEPIPSASPVHSPDASASVSGVSTPPTVGYTPLNHSSNVGAIVGGVIGGLAFLSLVIGLLYWRRVKRPSGEFRYGPKAHQDVTPAITPFVTTALPSFLHGYTPKLSATPVQAGTSAGVTSQTHGVDAVSVAGTSPGGPALPNGANTTASTLSRPPPAAPASQGGTHHSYGRPPSVLHMALQLYRPDSFSFDFERRGSEDLPAYSPS
ncbi:hypothetical protein BD413DRAFT_501251 [Trametes elegans]|nr:hypothetical protein BD413DRAFT_501251 [Trametes elegans]